MVKRIGILAACLVASACGGGGGNKGNPATATTFDYSSAPAQAATPSSVGATSSALASLATFQTSSDATSAMNVNGALMNAADEAFGDSALFAVAPKRALPLMNDLRARALVIGDLPNSSLPPGCGTVTVAAGVTTVTFAASACKVTQTDTSGESVTVTLSGFVTGKPGAVDWDLGIEAKLAGPQVSATIHFDDAGNVAVTETTAKGHQEASIHASASANGQSMTLGVAQSADLDVTIAPVNQCSTRVTGGTFEAKRVWTAVPNELRNEPDFDFRNKGVKLTWTGCGIATAQFVAR